eukprot:9508021-Ditylum_brightwellii.AAC.1
MILHVHGHQDKHKKYDELSLLAKLNVDADLLAVEYRAPNKKTARKVIQLPVNASANERTLMRYIAKKQLWSNTKMESINWGAFQIARKHQSQHSKQI